MAKTAGVRDFKAKVGKYLSEVKHGETVLVTERGQVVAQLTPPGAVTEPERAREEREAQQLLADGLVSCLGTQEEGEWPEPRPSGGVSREALEAALEAERGE